MTAPDLSFADHLAQVRALLEAAVDAYKGKAQPDIFERFRENVKRTGWKEGEGDLTSLLGHVSRLIPSEAGEVAGLLEKLLDQGHPLDVEQLILELGDVMWGIQLAAIALDVTLEEIMERNIEKLNKRYPGKRFTTEDSIARVDATSPSDRTKPSASARCWKDDCEREWIDECVVCRKKFCRRHLRRHRERARGSVCLKCAVELDAVRARRGSRMGE